MDEIMALEESMQAAEIIQNIRSELTNAVRTALIKQAYDTDVHLSFGKIHINSKGSISQISFNGSDVTDIDAFIVKQAFHAGDDNYFDIRVTIKRFPDDFYFYPIQVRGRLSLTVLKTSPFFERRYGLRKHAETFRVEYASKYMIVYCSEGTAPDIYYVGLFDPVSTANSLLEKAGKTLGGKSDIYYCFANIRPELFLHLGEVKSDFAAYHPEKVPGAYNFYKGSIISGVFRLNKRTDCNGKIKVKETVKKCLQLIIKMQYGTVDYFCELYSIDTFLMTSFLSGAETQLKYSNGNVLTPKRLEELLNLPFTPDAEGLKDKNLLIKVDYDEIPA